MDNDTLIDEARQLYAVLHVEQFVLSVEKKAKFDRLDHTVLCAYCRYQRRLNRCVLCYRFRAHDCNRDFWKKEPKFCPACINVSFGAKE